MISDESHMKKIAIFEAIIKLSTSRSVNQQNRKIGI